MVTNWEAVLSNRNRRRDVVQFATGELSGTELQYRFEGSNVSSEVRSLVRTRGVQDARKVARKALRRRNLLT